MRRSRLGCLSGYGMFAAAALVLAVGGYSLLLGNRLFSPGALYQLPGQAELGGVRSHSEIQDCSACHTAFWEAERMSDRCLKCHLDVDRQLKDGDGLHAAMRQTVGEEAGFTCYQCHTEHNGPTAALTIFVPDGFPHQSLGFSLLGHAQHADGRAFVCADCHGDTFTAFDQAVCAACHQELDSSFMNGHLSLFGSSCLACHDGADRYGKPFNHNQLAFPLLFRHALVDCQDCHTGARTRQDLVDTPHTCYACHSSQDAHGGQFGEDCAFCHTTEGWELAYFDHAQSRFPLVGAHNEVACHACHSGGQFTGTPATCYACHQPDDAHADLYGEDCARCHTPVSWQEVNFDHSQTRFTLVGKHIQVECILCHTDYPLNETPRDCYACHAGDDAHEGQYGDDCAYCHTPEGWDQAVFDHSSTAFPLTGQHVSLDCRQCHTKGTFRGTPQTCYACHARDDTHAGQLGQDCSACHTTVGWTPSTFDHSRTAFVLTGQHVSVGCTKCHTQGTFRGTPQTCYACHARDDAHSGQLGQDCATCHTTGGWMPSTFDHSRTAFALTGAHRSLSCSQCHGSAGGGLVFQGTPTDCAGCHNEPAYHQGLFGFNCAACHTTSAWLPAGFDGAHTFPINHGRNTNSSCRECHPQSLDAYTCYSCHPLAEIQEEHTEEGIFDLSDCASCHPTGEEPDD